MFQTKIREDWVRFVVTPSSWDNKRGYFGSNKQISGTWGNIRKQYFGDTLDFTWKTNHRTTFQDMTAYIDFS